MLSLHQKKNKTYNNLKSQQIMTTTATARVSENTTVRQFIDIVEGKDGKDAIRRTVDLSYKMGRLIVDSYISGAGGKPVTPMREDGWTVIFKDITGGIMYGYNEDTYAVVQNTRREGMVVYTTAK